MPPLDQVMDPSRQVELIAVEGRIASWIRKLQEPSPAEWQRAENLALRAMLDLATQDPLDLYTPNGKDDVLPNILARALGNCHRKADYETDFLATLSALAFASAGNFPNAAIYARRSPYNESVGAVERWMMQFLVNIRNPAFSASPPPPLAQYAQFLDTALETGFPHDFASASKVFHTVYRDHGKEFNSSDRYLLLIWRQVHQRLYELSVARILRESAFPHQGYADAVRRTTSPLFFPPQAQIAASETLTRTRENVLISLPTSTGKSLLGEMALVASLQLKPVERWLAVYLAPYRALTDQLFERMQERLSHVDIACLKRRGDYLTDMTPLQARRPTILVATPEAFDALLRQSPELYTALSACVFDEFHLIEQHRRGLRYEGILGRFHDGAAGQGWPKIIALSAVIADTTNVRQWLKVQNTGLFRSDWKPASRRIAIVSPQGSLDYFAVGEETRIHTSDKPAWHGQMPIPHSGIDRVPPKPAPQSPDHKIYNPQIKQLTANIRENIAAVAVDQHARFKEPILVLASTRADTQRIALQISNLVQPIESSAPSERLADEIGRRYPYLFTLRQCLRRGVTYHNASLPDWVRTRVEELITKKNVDFVVATTTLAEGVDMPFRVVVMADWQTWQFGEQRPMPSLLFQNISGRCGRAWEFAEGDTVLVDNPGRDSQFSFDDRYKQYKALYVRPTPYPLKSSVELSETSRKSDIRAGTRAVLESQFTAYVAVCGKRDQPEDAFARSLYAGTSPAGRAQVQTIAASFTEAMLTDSRYPVFQRNSPLDLTQFGEVVLQTGLSPRSGVALAHFFETYEPQQAAEKSKTKRRKQDVHWEPLLAAMWERVKAGSWVAELEDDSLIGQNPRKGYPPTKANFPEILMAWVSGLPIEEIAFLTLRTTEAKRYARRWLSGELIEPGIEFESWIEDLAQFCNNYLGAQWSWVCRGAALVAAHIAKPMLAEKLDELAKRLHYGVSQLRSCDLLSRGCPVERAKVDWAIRSYNELPPLLASTFPNWLRSESNAIQLKAIGKFERIRMTDRDIQDLADCAEREPSEILSS